MAGDRVGLRSDDLRVALDEALDGRHARLAELLARHGALPGPRPNLELARAFGEAVAAQARRGRTLLETLAADPASPDSPRAFLPIAAAFGQAARLEHDPDDAWAALFELAADDRGPVRVGWIAALSAYVARAPGRIDALVARAQGWVNHEDREHAFAAAALVLELLAEPRGLEGLQDPEALLRWVERVLGAIVDAPRAAERSPARRKVLAALPPALSRIASSLRSTPDGIAWLRARLLEARHPDVRVAMAQTIERLRRGAHAQAPSVIASLRDALASSAKPPRDPSRIREGTGRGRKGRRRSR